MTFGFAILICSSFFEGWASRVPGAQLIPPSYSTHVVPFSTAGASPVRQYQASQAGAQWKRLLVHSKAWKSGEIPWYFRISCWGPHLFSSYQFYPLLQTSIVSITVWDGNYCCHWIHRNWIWLKPPLGIFNLFLQSLGDLRNDERDESNDAASLQGWNLRGHQAKTWRCGIARYLKYHKYAIFWMVRIFQMAPVLIT